MAAKKTLPPWLNKGKKGADVAVVKKGGKAVAGKKGVNPFAKKTAAKKTTKPFEAY